MARKCDGSMTEFQEPDGKAIAMTAICFAAIFAVILVISLGRVSLSKPIELARSENHGEKPPKANWFIAGTGAVILAAAYYIAVSIEDPFSANNRVNSQPNPGPTSRAPETKDVSNVHASSSVALLKSQSCPSGIS